MAYSSSDADVLGRVQASSRTGRTTACVVLLVVAVICGCDDRGAVRDLIEAGRVDTGNGEPEPEAAADAAEADVAPTDASDTDSGESEPGDADATGPIAPAFLSDTGLYRNLSQNEELAPGVTEYRPRFELWSDGAEKRRFVSLPAGARIDTSDMDYWVYPPGTRLWKEFRSDGVRVETRLLEKTADDGWLMMAYAWNGTGTDASAVPAGAANVLGTEHDIPSRVMCGECHSNIPDRVLGFSAVQLAHTLGGTTLDDLVNADRLTVLPTTRYAVPGSDVAQAALGYLHANCGNCHNPRSGIFPTVQMELWLSVGSLQGVATTPAYRTTVGVPLQGVRPSPATPETRITPREPDASAVQQRMSVRDPLVQMPPLASELTDATGLSAVAAWISELEPR